MKKENQKNILEIINEARKNKGIKWLQVYEKLDMSKQGFQYHKKNLKKNKISFQLNKLTDYQKFLE